MLDQYTYRVIFSDSGGEVFNTHQDDIWVSGLTEQPPEIRENYLTIPGADGSIDLTEAVAGRPLYERRTLELTISHWAHDYAAAVQWAHGVTRLIHGRELKISTPASRALEGWMKGRVSVEVEYISSAVVLTVTAECDPWIYYGTADITLAPGTSSTVADGNPIPLATRQSYPLSLVGLRRIYTSFGLINGARRIALVESMSDNMACMPDMMKYCRWDISADDVADWGTAWVNTPVTHTSNALSFTTEKEYATRIMALSYPTATPDDLSTFGGMVHTARHMYLGLRVTGTVTDTDSTPGTPAVKVVHQGGRTLVNTGSGRKIDPPSGGLVTAGMDTRTTYTALTIADDGTVNDFVKLATDIIVWGTTHTTTSGAWCTVGVEVDWCDAELTCELFLGWDNVSYVAPDNVCRYIDLPCGLYADSSKQDTVSISPSGALFTSNFDDSSGAVVARADAETFQLATVRRDTEPKWVSCYMANLCWRFMDATITVSEQLSATVDAGDMPTTFTVQTDSPMIVDIDGTSYMVTSSGFAPFAFSGEKEIDYILYGADDAHLIYEKGRI